MVQQSSAIEIFCCYARKDEDLLNELKTHLSPLQRQKTIQVWHDGDISAGTEWDQEIKQHLNNAEIILLLISADFIASEYCYGSEMKRALERHKRREARVIPVILRPLSGWEKVPPGDIHLGQLQALPKNAKPVTSWTNTDEAWKEVAKGIERVSNELLRGPLMPQSTLPSSSLASVSIQKRVDHTKSSIVQRPVLVSLAGLVILALVSGVVWLTSHQQHSPMSSIHASSTRIITDPDPYPPGTWNLALFDPLSQPRYWNNESNPSFGGSCQFSNGAYHISQSKRGNFFCAPPTNFFSNLTVEVKMTIIMGDCGGIFLRGNGPAYFFGVCQNGQYGLYLYRSPSEQTLVASSSTAIHTGPNQSNMIAVVANRSSIDLYVNYQKINSASDSFVSSGEINFAAVDGSNPTEVAYSDARVWTP